MSVIYYDCKIPYIRNYRWFELLEDVAKEICKELKIENKYQIGNEREASKNFRELLKDISKLEKKICVMFDEIEYISFVTPFADNKHWKKDYIDFWQTMWSCQSVLKSISFIISGVNPNIIEKDNVDGIQNPLFGIVAHMYLTGLSKDEVKTMSKKFGKRMGLDFSSECIENIRNWYGGHPLLVRKAFSELNSILTQQKDEKPFKVSLQDFYKFREQIDNEISFYCNHAINEIKVFYPEEYEMFELLSCGSEFDFHELAQDESHIKHLCEYQLIKRNKFKYEINIPVIANIVAYQSKKESNRELNYPLVETKYRGNWIKRRIKRICNDFRVLESIILKKNKKKLFGANSFPEADNLININVSKNENNFGNFINLLNKIFVESIEIYGKEIKEKNYFWKDIKNEYTYLFFALDRIKVYRHYINHLKLNEIAQKKLDKYLEEDLEGKKITQLKEPYYILQQRILDRLLLGINNEIDNLT